MRPLFPREIVHLQPWELVSVFPGGRWFLSLFREGSVVAYDLEASVVQLTVLIPPNNLGDGKYARHISYCIHADEKSLTFDIALQFSPYVNSEERQRLSIWRTAVSTMGSSSQLSATHLRSFSITSRTAGDLLSLFGDMLAAGQLCASHKTYDVDVYRW
jgi:hypothetical protein